MHARVRRGNRYWVCGEYLAGREHGATTGELQAAMNQELGFTPSSIGELTAGVRQGLRRRFGLPKTWDPLPCTYMGKSADEKEKIYRYEFTRQGRAMWQQLVREGGERATAKRTRPSASSPAPRAADRARTSERQAVRPSSPPRPGQATLFDTTPRSHHEYGR